MIRSPTLVGYLTFWIRMASLRSMLVFAAVLFGCGARSVAPSGSGAVLGEGVSFALPTNGGQLVRVPLSSVETTVLDFWAPSCTPCRATLPRLVEREAELNAEGARLVLVAVLAESETTAQAEATLSSWGVHDSFLIDRGGVSESQAGVRALPTTLVVDRRGIVRWVAAENTSTDDVIAAAAVRTGK